MKKSADMNPPNKDLADNDRPISIVAVVTQIMFFFQLASLVHIVVQREQKDQSSDNEFIEALFNAFNFRFSVYREVCPMNDLTLIMKLGINLAQKLNTLTNVLWIFILHRCFSFITCWIQQHSQENLEEENKCTKRILELEKSCLIR